MILFSPKSKYSFAKLFKLFFIRRHASLAAIPFISEPDEAAVGEVFGTLAVDVADTLTLKISTPNSWATTCATLINKPWPISVPP